MALAEHESGAVVSTRRLTKRFPGTLALQSFDIDIYPGEIHALVGENGAGKSTFIKIIAGAYTADDGDIFVDGNQVRIRSPQVSQELGLSFIHQQLTNVPQFSVSEELTIGLVRGRHHGLLVDRKTARRTAREVAERLGLTFDLRRQMATLSAAQQQLVAIGRALIAESRVLVLDEPTAPLSAGEAEKLFEIVESLRDDGVAVVYVSHRLEEVFRLADRVTVLKDGLKVGTFPISEIEDKDHLIRLIVGRDVKQFYPQAPETGSEATTVLKVRDLRDGRRVHGVSFDLRKGEMVGLAGLVGSGRSELAHILFGDQRPSGGTIEVTGEVRRFRQPRQAIKSGIALLPEDRRTQGAILAMRVRENMTLASLERFRFAGALPLVNKRRERHAVKDEMSRLRVRARSAEQPLAQLSGGNQQKVILAKWLMTDSDILIFDEPTQGIDVGSKAEIYDLVDVLVGRGKSVVFISSDLEELSRVCRRVLVMREGRIVADLYDADEAEILRNCFEARSEANGSGREG
jgi:ABC-type sugar transport system ATPase subunit